MFEVAQNGTAETCGGRTLWDLPASSMLLGILLNVCQVVWVDLGVEWEIVCSRHARSSASKYLCIAGWRCEVGRGDMVFVSLRLCSMG